MKPININTTQQRGSVLLVSLIFVIVIGLMGLTSMQSSKLNLRISLNEELRANAFEIAQSLVDAVVATPAMTPVIGTTGFTLCTPGVAPCDMVTLSMPGANLTSEVASGHLSGTAVLLAPGNMPPPRGLGFSADKFSASGFQINTTYDRAAEGQGWSRIGQGLIVMTPLN